MAQSLREIIDAATSTAVASNNVRMAQEQLPPSSQPNPQPPRSFASPMDSYEENVGYDSPFDHLSPGNRRAMWQIPDVALTHTAVATLQSAGTPTTTQTNQIIGGVTSAVKAPAGIWGPVPNMQTPVVSTGPLSITASLSIQSTAVNDTVSFAFYRDGNQIGQIFTQTTPGTANKPVIVNLSAVDQPPLKVRHLYALHWKAGSGTLSAVGTQRSIYSLNLQPQ